MIYLFWCPKCNKQFDVENPINLTPPKEIYCPECKELAVRVYQVNVKKHKEMEG
jgi:transposase-like protein